MAWLEQRHRDLPELRGSGQPPVKSDDLRTGRLRESDQVAVGDRLGGRLEGEGGHGQPEQGLGAMRLGRELYARVLPPPVVELERPGRRTSGMRGRAAGVGPRSAPARR